MRSLKQMARRPLLLLLLPAILLLPAGCEDSGVIAPADGEMVMIASPTTVVIDDASGETEGQSTITAQLFDANGYAMQNVSVWFTTSSGSMASAPPGESPTSVETDANGFARDVLTLTLLDDSTVDVVASSGTLSGSVTVTKQVGSENTRPSAFIDVTPADEQGKNKGVTFDGSFSEDPDGAITCFKWVIDADRDADSDSVSKELRVWQGPARQLVSETYYKEQNVSVTLAVSDDASAATWCTSCEGPPESCGADASGFNGYTDSISYPIVCDTSDPTANGGGNQSTTVGTQITLDGSASDDADPGIEIVSWSWSCGNGTPAQDTEQATCTYSSITTYTATLTVTNSCGLTAQDEIQVTVNAAR